MSDSSFTQPSIADMQESVRVARSELDLILANIPTVVYRLRVEGQNITPIMASENVTRLLGFTVSETLACEWWLSQLHPDDRERATASVSEAMTIGASITEYRVRHKDGSYRWVEDARRLIRDATGRPTELVGVWMDITERKRVDQQLNLQAAALETSANAILIAEKCGTITWINPAFTKMTGFTAADAIGKTPRILKSGKHDQTFYRNLWGTLLSGKVWRGIFENRRKDGSLYQDEHTITPVRSSDGAITHFVCIMNDISERVRTEQQLRQAQKMEAVGQLAGGIAHDFNNLLTVINGHSELLLTRLKLDEKSRNQLILINKTGERAASLTRQLLAFSRQQILEPKVLNLNVVISDMNKMLQRLLPENIDYFTLLNPELAALNADPGQIEQVLMNLIVNARDAMPGGGKLTVETTNVELDDAYCRTHTDVTPGQYVMLSVSDNGTGMDTVTKTHVFEPFFTTKEQGKGTGLGLSTVFGIVKQSNGHVDVYSELGIGTTFKIYFPQTDKTPAKLSGGKLAAVPRGSETILVVEDEDGVRNLLCEVLQSHGYTVLVAKNGTDALRVNESHKGSLHLMITDVIMPEMGGAELAKRISALRPEMKMIFTSGYTDNAIFRNGTLETGVIFLQKPFTPLGVARKVREVLDA